MSGPGHAQIVQLASARWDDVARVQLMQTRERSFRPIALLQLPFYMIGWVFGLILAVVLSLTGDAEGESSEGSGLSLPTPRFFDYWQAIEVVLLSAAGLELGRASARPKSPAEVDGVVATILAAAQRQQVVVIQSIEGEIVERWWGGQPLLAPPVAVDPQLAAAALREAGFVAQTDARGFSLTRPSKPVGRGGQLVGVVLTLLILPIGVFSRRYRASLAAELATLAAGCTEATVLELTREGMLICRNERGSSKTTHFALPAPQLLAISFAPALLADRDVTRTPPALRFVTASQTFRYPLQLDGSVGAAARDLVVAAALQQWHDVMTLAQRATRCPYCGSVYALVIGQPCPSCGGWPSQVS